MYLGDAIDTAVLLEDSACYDILTLGDEHKWELADPAHYLAPVLAGSVFQDLCVRDHRILCGTHLSAPLQLDVMHACVLSRKAVSARMPLAQAWTMLQRRVSVLVSQELLCLGDHPTKEVCQHRPIM